MIRRDLANSLDASEDAVSYALKLLRTAGVVKFRKQGRVIFYRLSDGFPQLVAGALPARAADHRQERVVIMTTLRTTGVHQRPDHASDHGAASVDDDHQGRGSAPRRPISASLHCLTDCAIGEMAGLIIGTAAGTANAGLIAISNALAVLLCCSLSTLPLLKLGSPCAALTVVWQPTRCQSSPGRPPRTPSPL